MDLIRRGILFFRDEGLLPFIKDFLSYLRWKSKSLTELILHLRRQVEINRGYIDLSVGGTSARFVAKEEQLIYKTRKRFEEERYELMSILEEISEDDVFYDIGANTGIYSCFVGNRCPDCQVMAFEPYPPNLDELKENITLNDIKKTSVFDVALSDRSGTISFSAPEEPTPGHGTGSITEQENGESVRTVRGDELISDDEAPAPNIVKIDVEGSEPLVVDGMKNALSDERCRLVFCELHPSRLCKYNYNVSKMVAELEQMGYDIELHERWGKNQALIEARRDSNCG